MEEILIECSPGVSGDMLLGAFYDLGVPKDEIEKKLACFGLENLYKLNFSESQNCSIRGIKVDVEKVDQSTKRDWKSIKNLILKTQLEEQLKKRIYEVFESLAKAEGRVHGINPEEVHFHEIGAIDSLVDIIGVCTSIEYLKPKKVFCNEPTLGKGFIQADHGKLSIPSPAVIELLRKKNIKVISSIDSIEGELSTPTGIALLCNLVESFQIPYKYSIDCYGVGLGNLNLPCPNLVRILKINSSEENLIDQKISPRYEEICVQEAWIDDQTSEELSNLIEKFRKEGAYDVSSQTINMKKNRIGFSIQVILPIKKQEYFRKLWFEFSTTIGLRERKQARWVLLRRKGECLTTFGKIKFKQSMKPNGSIYMKPENDEILRLQIENNKTAEEVRNIIRESCKEFKAFEDWK
ncbi:nickel pincer cofactor biosynthesis protein LarC [Prochlorococcus sp. AH-716-O10]|nr:nickel pincer cofactor biosynthesis protein LarC [Prochlorococcus sp. AH-716-O10]